MGVVTVRLGFGLSTWIYGSWSRFGFEVLKSVFLAIYTYTVGCWELGYLYETEVGLANFVRVLL